MRTRYTWIAPLSIVVLALLLNTASAQNGRSGWRSWWRGWGTRPGSYVSKSDLTPEQEERLEEQREERSWRSFLHRSDTYRPRGELGGESRRDRRDSRN